jgi:hypothetical protein
MPRVGRKPTKNQHRAALEVQPQVQSASQHPILLDDGTITTPVALAMIQALIPLGLKAVEQALVAEVHELAGPRHARDDGRPDVVRWGAQRGSIYLADQKLPVAVPRVRDRQAQREVPLTTYAAFQTPRAQDVGLFRRVLGGLSCRDYEAAAEAVPEAFGLARSSVSRRFIRASANELVRLQERRLDDADVAAEAPSSVRTSRVCGCEARARATLSRASTGERIRGRESRRGTGGDADAPPSRRVPRTWRELQNHEPPRERDGAGRSEDVARDTLAHE